MYSDNTWITPLRIAEAHREADLERSLRPMDMARPLAPRDSTNAERSVAASAPIDTRLAGEPIAAAAAGYAATRTADQAA